MPVAYRTTVDINSVIAGVLTEKEYAPYSDRHAIGVELFRHHLQHVITAIFAFEKAKRDVRFLTVACPAEIVNATRDSITAE